MTDPKECPGHVPTDVQVKKVADDDSDVGLTAKCKVCGVVLTAWVLLEDWYD